MSTSIQLWVQVVAPWATSPSAVEWRGKKGQGKDTLLVCLRQPASIYSMRVFSWSRFLQLLVSPLPLPSSTHTYIYPSHILLLTLPHLPGVQIHGDSLRLGTSLSWQGQVLTGLLYCTFQKAGSGLGSGSIWSLHDLLTSNLTSGEYIRWLYHFLPSSHTAYCL